MSLTKKVYLTISGYDIKLSDNLMFYQKDQLKLIFYINEYGIDYENNATTRALMPVNPLNAILFIENPDGVDSVSSARIEDNAVTFYLDSTHTQYVGVSRMQLRLFDQDGCAITLPHFTFEIRENIYGSGDVRFQNVVMVDHTGTVILTEDNDLLDVGDILTMGTEVAYPQVAKTIKDLPIKHGLDGTEKLIVEDDEATKQAPLGTIVDEIKQNSQEKIREIESELAQTNAQLSPVEIIDLTSVKDIEYSCASNRKNTLRLIEEFQDTATISNLANVDMIFTNDSIINYKNNDAWDNSYYQDGKWNYNIRNAITFENLNDVVIKNLKFVQDKSDPNIRTFNAIVFKNCHNVIIEGCLIDGFDWCGISIFESCSDIKILNNRILRNRFGIYDKGLRTVIKNNTISNLYSESQEYIDNDGIWCSTPQKDSRYYDGIMAYGVDTIISHNYIYDNGQSGIYTAELSGAIITNNHIENNFNVGIDMGVTNNKNNISKILISCNCVKNNNNNEINITGVEDSIVTSNLVINTKTDYDKFGIILEGVSSNNTISNNKIIILANNSNRGVSIGANCINNKVLMNDVTAPIKYNKISGNIYFDEELDIKLSNKIVCDLSEKSGYDGRVILHATASSDNNFAQIICNKPVQITNASGNPLNLTVSGIKTNLFEANSDNNVFWLNDTTKLRLPRTKSSSLEKGYIWFDYETNELVFSDGSGNYKVVATKN